MSVGRVVLAASLCLTIVSLQLWQTVAERDDWPLSSFPMYSWRQPRGATRFTLVGVTATGEEVLTGDHTRPLTGARLRAVLGKGAKQAGKSLVPTLCQNLQKLGGEFSALRIYRHDWRINAELKGLGKKGKLVSVVPVLCPAQRERLEAASTKGAPPVVPVQAPPDTIVLEAEGAEIAGEATVVDDKQASGGRAVSLQGAKSTAPHSSSSRLTLRFEAPAGKYRLWLRGKTATKASLWAQVNEQIGTSDSLSSDGVGHFTDGFPKGVYVWSSRTPGASPVTVKFVETGAQSLVISLRNGRAELDQVVLTKHWPEHPLHHHPVMP